MARSEGALRLEPAWRPGAPLDVEVVLGGVPSRSALRRALQPQLEALCEAERERHAQDAAVCAAGLQRLVERRVAFHCSEPLRM